MLAPGAYSTGFPHARVPDTHTTTETATKTTKTATKKKAFQVTGKLRFGGRFATAGLCVSRVDWT